MRCALLYALICARTPAPPASTRRTGFVLTTLVLFLYLSIAAVVFLTFGAAGSWGNGASSQQHVKLDEESGASSAASSATYAGVVGDSSV